MMTSMESPVSRVAETRDFPVIHEASLEEEGEERQHKGFSERWTSLINSMRKPISDCVLAITQHAATHPYIHIVGVVHFSLSLMAFGLFTNFRMEVGSEALYGVIGSRIADHRQWINQHSGYGQYNARMLILMVHADGQNVVGDEGVRRSFSALDLVTGTPGYDELCRSATFVGSNGKHTCDVRGVTRFWNGDLDEYNQQVTADDEAIAVISQSNYPDGGTVDLPEVLGNYRLENATGIITFAESLILTLPLPTISNAVSFEGRALERLLRLQEEWDNEDGNAFRLEVQAERSLDDESTRSILKDIPLIPLVFAIMSGFTCFVFWKYHRVRSRSMLGFGAVVSVLLAIMSGYGFLFLWGVPFSMLTNALPFVLFGIGLDDAFIITGALDRTDPRKDIVERVHEAMEECSMSIVLTTATTSLCFGLGCISSIPAMKWLSFYAFPAVVFVFMYTITFFIAVCVLDAKRIESSRMDCCCCMQVEEIPRERRTHQEGGKLDVEGHISQRRMRRFANLIFRPWMKALVITSFAALAVACAISATKLENEFKISDVLPQDSYSLRFLDSLNEYGHRGKIMPVAYFRGVDQADEQVQIEMERFINDLVSLEQVEHQPPFFWLRDFKHFVNTTGSVDGLPFKQQLAAFLHSPGHQRTYGSSIVLDEEGNIESSRCVLYMTNLDLDDTKAQIDALHEQRQIAALQPINQGLQSWNFFTYEVNYYLWEFFDAAGYELLATTILGIIAVSGLGFILIPHYTAVLFVAPLITVLCIDLLGFLQFCGVTINAVSYMAVMMSIGLLVDFLMHILLRYYESNEETSEAKARDALESMGSSLLLGGLSTFLGIMPLAFSTSNLLKTIFIAFAGMVALGVLHGLVLLPVVLSLVGPTDCIRLEQNEELPTLTDVQASNKAKRKSRSSANSKVGDFRSKTIRWDDSSSSTPSLSSTAISSRSGSLETVWTTDSTLFGLP